VHDFAQRPNSDQLFGFAAGGFRDFTRIASSHPEMWRDICVANRHALLRELDAYMVELMRTRVLLAGGDAAGLDGDVQHGPRTARCVAGFPAAAG
jgi:prephenate dehydrogenase